MDLVDIDQVLDNLERDELERDREATKTTSTVAAVTLSANATEVRMLGDGATTSRSGAKNFVGVSQVFNSLDDYRNNVKSLEESSTKSYDWKQRDISHNECDENHKEISASSKEMLETSESVTKPVSNTIADANIEVVDVEDDGEDDEICNSNDIHKYTENYKDSHANNMVGSNTIVSTSDSLTTSSCSTFSSGPSPGNASITEELTTPPSSVAESEKPSALEILPIAQIQPLEQSFEMASAVDVQSQNHSVVDQKNNGIEDLATGLSSISITTASQSILPCEVTASSALGKVLNELSEMEEPTSQSVLQHCEGSNKVLPVTESKICVITEDCKKHANDEEAQKNLEDNADHHANHIPKQIQPITFCSTMDEISDTELDSMLQEMDIDEAAEQSSSPKILQLARQDLATEVIPNNSLEAIKSNEAESTEATSEPENSNSGDHMNADNFSQASTVEFAEIKAETNAVAFDKDMEEAVSYTSTDSDSISDKKADVDEQQGEQRVVDNLKDDENVRPIRPNTLDLATCNTQFYDTADVTPSRQQDCEGERNIVAESLNNEQINKLEPASNEEETESISEAMGFSDPHANLGKVPPIWVPDNMATGCMQCQQKFTMIKRRHHCRACGKVLCSVCCSQRIKLEFSNEPESRVCVQCFLILTQRNESGQSVTVAGAGDESGSVEVREAQIPTALPPTPMRSPNPNNPMEYCSTIPIHRQVSTNTGAPPSVIVPVGVLKKDGSYSSNSSNSSGQKTRKRKSVMFSDGIAPGSELASSMEQQWSESKQARRTDRNRSGTSNKPATPISNETRSIDSTTMGLVAQLFRGSIPPSAAAATVAVAQSASEQQHKDSKSRTNNSPRRKAESQRAKKLPPGSDPQGCFIPYEGNALPPICVQSRDSNCDYDFKEIKNDFDLVERLQKETLKFVVRNNFYVHVKIVNLNCCMNRTVINFTTYGMHHVGNDEIIILLEYKPPAKREDMQEPGIPKDIFMHLHEIYCEAEHGRPIAELSYTSPRSSNFLGSREYGGFIYIRATYQCLQEVIMPENPYLIGVLIHRHEIPWAKVFPLRLMLRLGAQYRYYPCPLISIRNRESVYAEIAQTIINFLADFRNYSYTLPTIRGMYIHMEDRQTTVLIPRNRQEDVNKAINNASDHILAFAGNFSKTADGHLVCMQNVNDSRTELYSYSTQAINIQGHARKVTGASFFVLNEALKSTSGLSGKCSIVEDGLMVQIMPTKMEEVRNALRNQNDIDIVCGPIEANDQQTELVTIKWVENDRDFNLGVKSPIDDKSMEGISSMRVHASFNYSNDNYSIRLTDIYILKFDEWYNATQATLSASSSDITRISEQVARSASMALIPFLDLLAAAGINKLALRATLHQENVCYEAGARGAKLPPLYMNALDNHLIPTLHNESSGIEEAIILELVFYILNV